MNSINKNDIQTIILVDFEDEDNNWLKEVKRSDLSECKKRILRLSECKTLKSAVEFLSAAHAEINLLPYIFVIVIEVEKNDANENHALEISEINKYFTREIIIQVVEEDQSSIFVRENECGGTSSSSLVQIHLSRESVDVEEEELLKSLESMDIRVLLSFLCKNDSKLEILNAKLDSSKSVNGWTLLDIAVLKGKNLCLKFLKLLEWDLSDKNGYDMRPLEVAARFNQLNSMKILLDIPLHYSEQAYLKFCLQDSRKLLEEVDCRGNSVLMIAAMKGNLKMIEFLLDFHPSLDRENDNGERAADLAFKNHHYNVLNLLIKFDSPFPKNENAEKFIDKKIIEDRQNFHVAIEDEELEDLETFIRENPRIKCGYNEQNISALSLALSSSKFNEYSYLRSQGFSNGIDDTFHKYSKPDDSKKQWEIAEANFDVFEPLVDNAMVELLAKSKLGFDVKNRENSFNDIKNLFGTLLKIKEVRSMVIYASNFKNLQIIFDVNQKHIQVMDPRANDCTLGRTYSGDDVILVGAKNYDEALGTTAHELTHYALDKIYKNDCKPYQDGDKVMEKRFTDIELATAINQKNLSEEETVERVFKAENYDKQKQTCELAVRVPEMYAKYHNDLNKLNRAKALFPELFKYHDEVVKKAFEIECMKLQRKQFIKLNDLCTIVPSDVEFFFIDNLDKESFQHQKTLVVCSEGLMSFLKVYQHFLSLESKVLKVCANLDSFLEDSYLKQIQKCFPKSKESVFVIVETVHDESTNKVSKNLVKYINSRYLENHKNKLIVLLHNEKLKKHFGTTFDCEVKIEITWSQLTVEFLEKHLATKFLFQNFYFSLSELLNFKNSVDENFLKSELFCLKNQRVNIQKLEECKFFIERTFFDEAGESNDDDEILENNSKIKIIADLAGMGKTTTLEHLQIKLVKEYPKLWISLVYLKEKYESFSDKFVQNMEKNFLEYFVEHFLNLQTTAEKVISKSFYLQGKFMLLLDGFDEISPVYNEKVLTLIKLFKSVKGNELIITSRLHVLDELRGIDTSTSVFRLHPFTYEDQIIFLQKYWMSKRKEPDENQISIDLGAFAVKAHNLFTKFTFSRDLQDFIGIPLQTRMLAEIVDNDSFDESKLYEIFSGEKSLYDFYEMFKAKLLKTWMNKGELAKDENVEIIFKRVDLMKLHESAAIQMNFSSNMCKDLELPLVDEYPLEMIVRLGILQKNSSKSLKFIHGTFSDFFLADFICQICKSMLHKNLTESKMIAMLEILLTVLTTDQHEITRIFINDQLGKKPEFIDDLNQNSADIFLAVMTKKSDFSVLHKPIMKNQNYLVKLVLKLLSNSTSTEALLRTLQDKDINNVSAFQKLFQFSSSNDFLESSVKFLCPVLDQSDIKTLLCEKSTNSHNVLQISLKNKTINSFSVALKLFRSFSNPNELKDLMTSQDDEKNTLLHLLVSEVHDGPIFETIWKIIASEMFDDYEKFFKIKNIYNKNIFFTSCENQNIFMIENILAKLSNVLNNEEMVEMITTPDIRCNNILQTLAFRFSNDQQLIPLLRKIKDISENQFEGLLFQVGLSGENSVVENFVLYASKADVVKSFCDFLSDFLGKSKMKTLLLREHFMFYFTGREVCKIFFDIINSKFDKDDVKAFVTYAGYKKENSLHLMGIHNKNPEFMMAYIDEARKIIGNEVEFKKFLLHYCQDKNTPLHAIVSCNQNPEVFNTYWSIISGIFNENEQKTIIRHVGFNGRHVLHRSIENGNKKMSSVVFKIVKTIFTPSEITELFFTKDSSEHDMLQASCSFQNPIWLKIMSYCEIDAKKLYERFNERINGNISILMMIALNADVYVIRKALDLMKKYFELQDLKKLFFHVDAKNRKVLQYFKDVESLEFCLTFIEKNFTNEEFLELKNTVEIMEIDDECVNLENLTNASHKSDDLQNFWRSLLVKGELMEKVHERNGRGQTLLHRIAQNSVNSEAFKSLWNILKNLIQDIEEKQKLFTETCDHGLDCLGWAALNEKFDMVNVIITVEENLFDDFKSKLCKSYTKNATILHIVGIYNENHSVLDTILKKLEKYLDRDELKEFLCAVDDNNDTALNLFVTKNESAFAFYSKIRDILSMVAVQEMFTQINNSGENFFIVAAQSRQGYLKYFLPDLKLKLNEELLVRLLMHRDNKNMNTFHHLTSKNDLYLIELLKTFENLNSILISTDDIQNTIFLHACKNSQSSFLESLLDYINESFAKTEIEVFINYVENQGINIFEASKNNSKLVKMFLEKLRSEDEPMEIDDA